VKGNELKRSFWRSISQNAYILLSLCSLFWAGNFIIGRGVRELVPPLALAFLRWLIASILLFPIALPHLRRDWPQIRSHLPVMLALGALGIGGFNTLAYIGLNHTSALNGLIIQSAGPIMIMLAALAMFSERIRTRQLAGILISLCGVMIVISKGNMASLAALKVNIGDAWILAAMGVWALYTVLLRLRPDIHFLSFAAATFIIGAAVNLPLFLHEHFFVRRMEPAWASLAALAYVGIFPSILSYLLYNRGVEIIGSNRAGAFLHLIPLFGAGMAILLLGESLHGFHLAGFAMIIGGVFLAARA
jgi:drug/metabolite transporter (DMT)-like permease